MKKPPKKEKLIIRCDDGLDRKRNEELGRPQERLIDQPPKQEDWEKEFEERFIELHPKMDCTKPTPIWDYQSLISFIRNLIAKEREEARKEGMARGMRLGVEDLDEYDEKIRQEERERFAGEMIERLPFHLNYLRVEKKIIDGIKDLINKLK
jgi:hypothetical protein